MGRTLRPPRTHSPRRLWHLCPLCPTRFLVPSGAYDSDPQAYLSMFSQCSDLSLMDGKGGTSKSVMATKNAPI